MKKSFGSLSFFRGLTLAALVCTAGLATSSAIILPPGGFLSPVPSEPGPIGGLLLSQVVSPYAGADIQGTLVSSVYQGGLLPGLTFTYEIFSAVGSQAPVEAFTVGNYGPFLTDVSYDAGGVASLGGGGGGVAPVYVNRNITGNVISFNFSLFGNPGILPGQSSALLVIQTDAQFYSPTIASVINAGSAQVPSFAPQAVPEPATFALLGIGAMAGAMLRRRR